jgi:hypothetical protein
MTIGRIDAIGDQSTAPGTSDFVIDGVALTGMLPFSGNLTDALEYRYRAQNSANTSWEVGIGTWTAGTNTLSRTTVYKSSNGGAKTNFTDTTAVVVTMTAADFADAATDANISMSDITTNDVSTTKHGFAPKAPNVTTQFLSGDGTWRTPSGGTPAGAGTELQYRNAGAFGAMAGTAWDNTNRAETRTGATVTTSNPVQSFTQTWNDAGVTFTGWKLNITSTASAAASLLADWQIGGVSKGKISKDGDFTAAQDVVATRNLAATGSVYVGSGFLYANTGGNNGQLAIFSSVSGASSGASLTLNGRDATNRGGFALAGPTAQGGDGAAGASSLKGVPAYATAVTNITGGALTIAAGDGAASAAGDAHGGNLTLSGGTGYGTGHAGYIVLSNVPTSSAGLPSGAIWSNSGVLTIV